MLSFQQIITTSFVATRGIFARFHSSGSISLHSSVIHRKRRKTFSVEYYYSYKQKYFFLWESSYYGEVLLCNFVHIDTDFFFFLWCWGLNSGLHLEPLHQPFLCDGFFQDRVSGTICPGWLGTSVLLIVASWAAGFIGWATGTWLVTDIFKNATYRSFLFSASLSS
jgi:hypothetical protein